MNDDLLTSIQGQIRQGDELHAQHVAELERTNAGLHEVLRDLATSAMKLAEIGPSDTAVIEDVVSRARLVLDYLDPPSH